MRRAGVRVAFGLAFGLASGLGGSLAGAAPAELGLNVHQSADTGVPVTEAAGLGWVRIDVNWFDVEKAVGVSDWSVIDAVVAAANAKGRKVLAVLAYTPAWASQGDAKGGGRLNDVPKAGTFGPFVTTAVNRLRAKGVTHYEMWNEPNLGQFFEGTPQDYIDRILVPGADALHAACPTCKVVGPGLATVGGEYATWMDAVLAAAAPRIDIVSGHIYAGFPPPGGGGAGTTSDSFWNKLESHRVLKVGGATVYEGPLSFKEVMDKRGVTKPFWLTETGFEANLGNAGEEAKQVEYYRKVLEAMLSRPWWTSTIFYEAFDEPAEPYRWGVVVRQPATPPGWVAKPVFSFLKKVTGSAPFFGGTKTECDDGLDNDNDGAIDFPADTTCKSAADPSEGVPKPTGVDAGGGSSGGTSGTSGTSGGGPDPGSNAGPGAGDAGAGPGGGGDPGGCEVGARETRGWAALAMAAGAMAMALRRRRGR